MFLLFIVPCSLSFHDCVSHSQTLRDETFKCFIFKRDCQLVPRSHFCQELHFHHSRTYIWNKSFSQSSIFQLYSIFNIPIFQLTWQWIWPGFSNCLPFLRIWKIFCPFLVSITFYISFVSSEHESLKLISLFLLSATTCVRNYQASVNDPAPPPFCP